MKHNKSSFIFTKITIAIVILLHFSCSGIQKTIKIEIKRNFAKNPEKEYLGDTANNDCIKINYIGCGGFLIQNDSTAIMLDPYFSNISPLPLTPFKKLKTDTALIDSFFKKNFHSTKDEKGKIKAILVAHSHYDHLADVPSIHKRNCNQDSTKIIGSTTTQNILKGVGDTAIENSFKNINDYLKKDAVPVEENIIADTTVSVKTNEAIKSDTTLLADIKAHKSLINKLTNIDNIKYDWIYTNDSSVRILPIDSEHAPHICHIKLISSKKIDTPLEKFPQKVTQFHEGANYNFLIDFLKEDTIMFRIFSHAGAACDGNKKEGFPPLKIIQEKKVDVLLLCVASFNQVKAYPEKIIEFVKPKRIVLNHWENFFKPMKKLQQKAMVVPATNLNKFILRLKEIKAVKAIKATPQFILPKPLTEIIVHYDTKSNP